MTGSCHLLEVGSRRILLDCGLFDADRLNPDSPNRRFDFDPKSLDAVVISHAHNDHIGRLACLTKAGYRGPMFATRGTADIINIMLRDSARIQHEDAKNIAWSDAGEPLSPLFGQEDVDQVVESLQVALWRNHRAFRRTFLDVSRRRPRARLGLGATRRP